VSSSFGFQPNCPVGECLGGEVCSAGHHICGHKSNPRELQAWWDWHLSEWSHTETTAVNLSAWHQLLQGTGSTHCYPPEDLWQCKHLWMSYGWHLHLYTDVEKKLHLWWEWECPCVGRSSNPVIPLTAVRRRQW
jgi:hypothetical protein